MPADVLLITPPFTQLNTPYPATAYLKGFLNTKNISSFQADLGLDVTLKIFCKEGLIQIFKQVRATDSLSDNAKRIVSLKQSYIDTIDLVIGFLQGHNATLAHLICKRDFLPEASRFEQLEDLDWAFGNMGIIDMAKHLATMYLEDLSDLIKECIDEHFGFSRYAEKLGRSAGSFDELYLLLHHTPTYVDQILLSVLDNLVLNVTPKLVAISVPFPGNLYAAFRCGQWIKTRYPHIELAMGGGFANTELRSLRDARVFEFVDYITLDDGEAPILSILNYQTDKNPFLLKRTFILAGEVVKFYTSPLVRDFRQSELGTPDYADLPLKSYISAIEVINPMHRLWSDGRWNKLTMAHGCYWGKCTFCDISLDYIKLYEPATASLLCDRMEELIEKTNERGFHFVDEAAPPSLMKALAIEIIKRKLVVSWWTNVRFEKSFTRDLCLLLKASGCIAVSGGLEVASDRLLALIQKGITVAQVARVNKNFTQAGIMVHAYLMYGFPTQTDQETIDSLEMVRQLFKTGVLQSAFWHQFTMTAHSPIGLEPAKFNVRKENAVVGSFANNDLVHTDDTGTDHAAYSYGLKKSLLNYMHQLKLDESLQKWFDFKTPRTTVSPDYILNIVKEEEISFFKPDAKIIWLGNLLNKEEFVQSKKGNSRTMMTLVFATKRKNVSVQVPAEQGRWLVALLPTLGNLDAAAMTMKQLKESYEEAGLEDFELFWDNKPVNTLYKVGLLKL